MEQLNSAKSLLGRIGLAQLVLGALVILTVPIPSWGAIIIDGYSAQTNNRFANGPNFAASGLDLSGIGRVGSQWATAISRNVVISANHARPATNSVVTFHSSNDLGTATVVTRTITSQNQRIGTTDLWIGVLDSALPPSIADYKFATTTFTAVVDGPVVSAGSLQGENAYLVGLPFTTVTATPDLAVGRNRVSGFALDSVTPADGFETGVLEALLFVRDAPGAADFVQYEAYLQSGDSGAPSFALVNNELILLGTNAGIGPTVSAINYTGNQSAFIQSYISAVPEPGSLLLLGLVIGTAGTLKLVRSRRSLSAKGC